jgi:hypothetical protein
MELSPVGQKKFQAEQDRNRGTGWIALGELGQQRHGATKIRRLVCTEPEINAARHSMRDLPQLGARHDDDHEMLPGDADFFRR